MDDVIKPSVPSVILSDIICFNSPLQVDGWKELDGKRLFQFIDGGSGIAVAKDTGNTVVASYDSQKQIIFTKVSLAISVSFLKNIKVHRRSKIEKRFFFLNPNNI